MKFWLNKFIMSLVNKNIQVEKQAQSVNKNYA